MLRIFTAFLALSILLRAQAHQSAEVDRVFAEFQRSDSPGCAAGVEAPGRAPWVGAYGMADLEHAVPNTPETVFEVGSVSKQFTAAAVLLLAERGRLSLEDDIRKYFPELGAFPWHITVRELLSHTSGLRDWGEIEEIAGWPRTTREYKHSDVLDVISRQQALNYLPGEAWSYTNSGYNLAAMLVERVSKTSLQDFSRKEFFLPLGMNSTQWRDNFRRVVRNRAIAYINRGQEWRQLMPFEDVYGNGGLLTTVGDLLKWNRNLTTGKLHPALFKQMQEPSTLSNGTRLGYGFGFFLGNFGGFQEIAHSGATAAYVAWLGRYPAKDLSIAVACNAATADTLEIGHRLARLFAAFPASTKPTILGEVKNGLYVSVRDHSTMKVERTAGGLRLNERPNKLNVRVENDNLIFHDPVYGDDVYKRVVAWKPADFGEYRGTYSSQEAQSQLEISVKEKSLTVRNSPHSSFVLEPTYEDGFECDLGNLHFSRNSAGKIVGLRLSGQRVWDLQFIRRAQQSSRN